MKYNKAYSQGETFDSYLKYLETVKDKFPEELFKFVSDTKRHDLEEKSLHDSWVDEIKVSEKRQRQENRGWQAKVQIVIVLLSPYHDRTFELKFSNVSSYKLGMQSQPHGDLITYEIYVEDLGDENVLVFNAEFADDSIFLIKAEHIKISETLFEKEN